MTQGTSISGSVGPPKLFWILTQMASPCGHSGDAGLSSLIGDTTTTVVDYVRHEIAVGSTEEAANIERLNAAALSRYERIAEEVASFSSAADATRAGYEALAAKFREIDEKTMFFVFWFRFVPVSFRFRHQPQIRGTARRLSVPSCCVQRI